MEVLLEKQKFELFNDLLRFQYKVAKVEELTRKQVTSAYARLQQDLARHPDYLPIYVTNKRSKLDVLLMSAKPPVTQGKAFWVNTADYMFFTESNQGQKTDNSSGKKPPKDSDVDILAA